MSEFVEKQEKDLEYYVDLLGTGDDGGVTEIIEAGMMDEVLESFGFEYGTIEDTPRASASIIESGEIDNLFKCAGIDYSIPENIIDEAKDINDGLFSVESVDYKMHNNESDNMVTITSEEIYKIED